jgi:hypothetical protein
MDDYVKPLVEEYERLAAQVEQTSAALTALREKRDRLRRAVQALAPETLGTPPTKSKTKKYPVGVDSVDRVRAVVANLNGATFTPTSLQHAFSQLLPSEATVARALRVMHSSGELRLVKTGRGGQKTYEVIR